MRPLKKQVYTHESSSDETDESESKCFDNMASIPQEGSVVDAFEFERISTDDSDAEPKMMCDENRQNPCRIA